MQEMGVSDSYRETQGALHLVLLVLACVLQIPPEPRSTVRWIDHKLQGVVNDISHIIHKLRSGAKIIAYWYLNV